jgi:hypothetical protein
VTTDSDAYPPRLTGSRLAEVSAAARAAHRVILRAFAAIGHPPDPAILADTTPTGDGLGELLRELHDHDVIRLDEHGHIRAAYPFSGIPTAHTVAIDAGATVYAMCAIDALGIADMLGRNTTITSADPVSGQEITVSVVNGHATWEPTTVVVFAGSDSAAQLPRGDCCPPSADGRGTVAAADRCCGVMNFFTSPASAQDWLASHPTVSGVVLNQAQALRLGVDIFGHLLDD